MTTRPTLVKRFLTPLAQKHPDLAVVGRRLFVRPIHHIACCVFLDSTQSPGQFVPRYVMTPIFSAGNWLATMPGALLYHRHKGLWYFDDPEVGDVLRTVIEEDALPILRATRTIAGLQAFRDKNDNFFQTSIGNIFRCIGYDAARNLLDEAKNELESLATQRDAFLARGGIERMKKDERAYYRGKLETYSHFLYYNDIDSIDFYMMTLYPLVAAKDRTGIAKLLLEWERETVEANKIAHLWEPTPFPVEEMAN